MQTLSHLYTDDQALSRFVKQLPAGQVLVQVFSGVIEAALLTHLATQIQQLLPKAAVLGATTSGSIYQGKTIQHGIVLSFSIFDDTQVLTRYYPQADAASGHLAALFAQECQAVCVIAFGDVFHGQPHQFLRAFAEQAPDLIVAGGNAADQDRFEQTLLIHQHQVYSQGMVLALLINPNLHCHNDHLLNWVPVGKTMTVTACKDNIIYSLDNEPIIKVYQRYLGEEVVADIPNSIMAFPLLKCTSLMPVARSAIAQQVDGSLIYAGDFAVGDRVRFGIPDHQDSEHNACVVAMDMTEKTAMESLFIYSCTARRVFLGDDIDLELSVFQDVLPVTGFFTYGEYYHSDKHNQTLNITTTILALSESQQKQSTDCRPIIKAKSGSHSTLKSLVNLVNVTAKELSSNLRLMEQYRSALDQASIVSKTDNKGNIIYVNERFEEISGYKREEVLGKNHNILRHPDMPKQAFKELWRTILDKKVWRGIVKNRRKDGSAYTVKSTIVPILDDYGNAIEYISIRNDITELLQTQAMMEQQFIDKLTSLPNRNALLHDIEINHLAILGLIDIRNFKAFNDFYGIDFSDRILVEFSSWLVAFAEHHRLAAYRVFGNRFALVRQISCKQGDCDPYSCGLESFQRILYQLWSEVDEETFVIEESNLELDVLIGIGVGEHHLLPLAESAINQAKQLAHQRQIIVCDDRMMQQKDHLHWVYEIRDALAEGRIVNFYQPIVSLQGEQTKKYEALVRLIQRDGTVVSPFMFLDVAKKTRYYQQITRTVFDQSLVFAACHHADISVNLSIEDIVNESLRQHILRSLQQHVGGLITLEITESESIEDYALVKKFIDAVHRARARVAIDDFGSGYSNFAYLVEMKADYLKIDGSIIKEILIDPNSLLITESIVDVARKLKIAVVAEFVSDQAIAQKLIELGIDYAQGYFYGIPKSLNDLT